MISGNIYEKEDLRWLPAPLREAVDYLKTHDLVNHEPGRFQLKGDHMILQVLDLSTAPRETLRPECHRKYIDVQFLAAGGPERIAWYPDRGDNKVEEDLLDTPRDIRFYHSDPARREGIIEMEPGSYAMFFPWDVHVPAIQVDAPAPIRKIVIKVELADCL